MPHLRLEVPEEWLRQDQIEASGFDPKKLLDHLVEVVVGLKMPKVGPDGKPVDPPETVGLINRHNLKHGIVPLHHTGVGGDHSKKFLHATLQAGNDIPGRTADVRFRASWMIGDEIDAFTVDVPNMASVTVHILDIDRSRGYSTTAERKKRRAETQPA